MPRKKGTKIKKVVVEVIKPEVNHKEEIINLLLKKVPGLFDRFPMGSMSRNLIEKLADDILCL